jgi:hypothetical protein
MSFYRLCESHISRPRSAVEAAAYRSGKLLEHDGKPYDYSWRNDIVHTEIVLPERAPPELSDRQTLWNVAEKAEDRSTRRKTARLAHEVLISFPRVLSPHSWVIMARELIAKCFESQGMIADLAIHRGDRKDEEHPEADHKDVSPHNPHGHIMLTTRHIEREGFSRHKAREWESWGKPELLVSWRKEWADIQNRMFERKGLPYRVSHEKGGISREDNEYERDQSRGR